MPRPRCKHRPADRSGSLDTLASTPGRYRMMARRLHGGQALPLSELLVRRALSGGQGRHGECPSGSEFQVFGTQVRRPARRRLCWDNDSHDKITGVSAQREERTVAVAPLAGRGKPKREHATSELREQLTSTGQVCIEVVSQHRVRPVTGLRRASFAASPSESTVASGMC